MLSFEQMNIYDVLVLSGAGENRIVWLPSAQKVGGGNRASSAVAGARWPLQTPHPG